MNCRRGYELNVYVLDLRMYMILAYYEARKRGRLPACSTCQDPLTLGIVVVSKVFPGSRSTHRCLDCAVRIGLIRGNVITKA
jgi:hypothetical protein